jgi:hypothetical protein
MLNRHHHWTRRPDDPQRQAAGHHLQHQQLLHRRRRAVRLQLPGHHRERPVARASMSNCHHNHLCMKHMPVPMLHAAPALRHWCRTVNLRCAMPTGICVRRTQCHPGDPGHAAQPAADAAAVHARCGVARRPTPCLRPAQFDADATICNCVQRKLWQLSHTTDLHSSPFCRSVHRICHRVMVLLLGRLLRVRLPCRSFVGYIWCRSV